MYAFLGLAGFLGFIVSLIIIIIKAIKKQPKKKFVFALAACFALFIIALIITPSSNSDTPSSTAAITTAPAVTTAPTATIAPAATTAPNVSAVPPETIEPTTDISENDALKQELKNKYDVEEPQKFVSGDATGNWRIVKVANGTPPSDYAVEYARAYMLGADAACVHYIVNFSLNTTTMIRVMMGTVEAKTTEYVSKEEHDASIIGQGMLYSDKFYYLETGEEIKAEINPDAGIVSNEDLVNTVREAIGGAIGEGEKITDVRFDGTTLTVSIDLSGAKSVFSARDIALSRISSITDNILDLEDKYYNTWETITLDFGNEGTAVLDKSLITDQGFGKYFNFSDDILK